MKTTELWNDYLIKLVSDRHYSLEEVVLRLCGLFDLFLRTSPVPDGLC